MFELFDPKDDLLITQGGNLPHWYQPGVTYFVTWRTEDSIPKEVSHLWHRRRDDWLRRHGVSPPSKVAGRLRLPSAGTADLANGTRRVPATFESLPQEKQREFHDTFSREYLEHLDRGHGECVLRRAELSKIVADSLLHFDGQRYHVSDFVVMPNHVHILVCLLGDTEIEAQCYSWKKFTATEINRRLKQRGRFWQEESFDHLVRSVEQFEAIQRYIAANPAKAGLARGEYWLYRRK
jgi:REP element-mobilizing transposase RayT